MMLRLVSRLLRLFLLLLLVAVMVGLGLVWSQTWREYETFGERHAEVEQRLAELREHREEKEAYLRAFLNDPEFVERVVRERLGYVRPDETVFRFGNR
jgi:cell division protein FtsB